MAECLACEKQYNEEDSNAGMKNQYCSLDCEIVYEAALRESAESSKIRGLVDAEGNSILGNAYQQAVDRTIREATSRLGIKLPPKE